MTHARPIVRMLAAFGALAAAASPALAAPAGQPGSYVGTRVVLAATGGNCPAVGNQADFSLIYQGPTKHVVIYAPEAAPTAKVARYTLSPPAKGLTGAWAGAVTLDHFPGTQASATGTFKLTVLSVSADSFTATGTLALVGQCTSTISLSAARSGS